MNVKVTFPSGHVQWIEIPDSRERGDRPKVDRVPRTNAHNHACKHVGNAINISQGCTNKQFDKWSCELYGQCLPLAMFRKGTDGTRTCLYCESYEPSPDPGLIQEIRVYGSALIRWTKAGSPVRPQEKVNEIFAICTACPFLRKTKQGTWCGKCGCPVNTDIKNPMRNKIAMATEACPLTPPMWEAEL